VKHEHLKNVILAVDMKLSHFSFINILIYPKDYVLSLIWATHRHTTVLLCKWQLQIREKLTLITISSQTKVQKE